MAMGNRSATAGAPALVISQWASAQVTVTAGSTTATTATVTLPGGQTGYPRVLRVSGSASGQASITFGASAQVIALCNPNAPYSDVRIPPSAFPNPTGAVPVSVIVDAAGTVRVAIGFQ